MQYMDIWWAGYATHHKTPYLLGTSSLRPAWVVWYWHTILIKRFWKGWPSTTFVSNVLCCCICHMSYRKGLLYCAEMELGLTTYICTQNRNTSICLSLSPPPFGLQMDQWVQMRWTTAISFYLALITCINHPVVSTLHSSSCCIHSAACWCPASWASFHS